MMKSTTESSFRLYERAHTRKRMERTTGSSFRLYVGERRHLSSAGCFCLIVAVFATAGAGSLFVVPLLNAFGAPRRMPGFLEFAGVIALVFGVVVGSGALVWGLGWAIFRAVGFPLIVDEPLPVVDDPLPISDDYIELRNHALAVNPVQLGLKPDPLNPIFGVLMEASYTGYQGAVVTLVAMGDGSVSVYFSNGSAIVGSGEHEAPRKAGLSFLAFANQFSSQLQPTQTFPLPENGYSTFYFLTMNGVLTHTDKEADLMNGRLPLSPLFHQGHQVIAEVRSQTEFPKLMNAATTGDAQTIKTLIEEFGLNPDASDPTGRTPLMAASYNGKADIVELLLNARVSIDAKDSSGCTALMFACFKGQMSCVNLLIEMGANVNEAANNGSTPLIFCAQHGYHHVVRLLLDKGADPRVKDKRGFSAIEAAKRNGFAETKRILEAFGGA